MDLNISTLYDSTRLFLTNTKRSRRKYNFKINDEQQPESNPLISLFLIEAFRSFPICFLQLVSISLDACYQFTTDCIIQDSSSCSNENAFLLTTTAHPDSVNHWKRLNRQTRLIHCECLSHFLTSLRELTIRSPINLSRTHLCSAPSGVAVDGGVLVANSFWATILNLACGYGQLTATPRVRTQVPSSDCVESLMENDSCDSTSVPNLSPSHIEPPPSASTSGSRLSARADAGTLELDVDLCPRSACPEQLQKRHLCSPGLRVRQHHVHRDLHLESSLERLLRATCALARALHPTHSPTTQRCAQPASSCASEPDPECAVCPLARYAVECEASPSQSRPCDQHLMGSASDSTLPLVQVLNRLLPQDSCLDSQHFLLRLY